MMNNQKGKANSLGTEMKLENDLYMGQLLS